MDNSQRVARARTVLAALREPVERDEQASDERAIAYHRALRSGALESQVEALKQIYARSPETPDRQYVVAIERAVYDELAQALGRTARELKAETRHAVLGEPIPALLSLPDRHEELATHVAPTLEGYGALGAIAIDSALAVGDLAPELTLVAQTGVWFVYERDSAYNDAAEADDDGVDAERAGAADDAERHHVIAVHRDGVGQLMTLERDAVVRGDVSTEGASLALGDRIALEDRDLVEDAALEGAGVYGQRCVVWNLDGDGQVSVRAAERDGGVVYVRVG